MCIEIVREKVNFRFTPQNIKCNNLVLVDKVRKAIYVSIILKVSVYKITKVKIL